MDFKSLINKIESIDGPISTPKSPQNPEPIRLDEDTELRVLAGITALTESVITEKKAVSTSQQQAAGAALAVKRGEAPKSKLTGASKEMLGMSEKELEAKAGTKHTNLPDKKTEDINTNEEMKVGDTRKSGTGGTITKTEKGVRHTAGNRYGGGEASDDSSDDDNDRNKGKKAKTEDVEFEFKSKFMKMVEAKKKSKIYKKDQKVEETKKKSKMYKKDQRMEEAKKPDADNDGVPDWADKNPGKDDNQDKKGKKGKKGMTAKQAKYFGKGKRTESVESVTAQLNESTDAMNFKQMMNLVIESGGQQKIDAVDKPLFAWATRVAENKLGEGIKAEIYAGLVYERMGGKFELYDVLSENTDNQ